MLLEISNLSKHFGGVRALTDVSLAVEPGTITALLGDNGAGKSTLMRCVTGSEIPDAGTIRFCGNALRAGSPHDSRAAGIEMIYQELDLCPMHDGISNIFLGRESKRTIGGFSLPFLDHRRMAERAQELIDGLNAEIDLRKSVGRLSGGQRQAVVIARALMFQPKLLIMDEPTAALGPKEAARVLDLIKALRQSGIAVVLIAHRLSEVFEVADRAVLMRHGSIAEELQIAKTTLEELSRKMLG